MRQKLQELRLGAGLTQDQIARKTGTTKEYYSCIERGERVGTLPYWIRLQKFFKLKDAELWALAKEGVVFENKSKARA